MVSAMTDRFLVFGGLTYYPSGGWEDYIGRFPTIEAAKAFSAEWLETNGMGWLKGDWVHIVDVETGETVYDRHRDDDPPTD